MAVRTTNRDDSPHYYMEWIEASSPRPASAKLKEWRALLASAKPFAREPVSRLRYLLELRLHQWPWRPRGTASSPIPTARRS